MQGSIHEYPKEGVGVAVHKLKDQKRHYIQHPLDVDLIVFDIDGTLRGCKVEGQSCPNHPAEQFILPDVARVLNRYNWKKTQTWLISNQGGIGLGYLSDHEARNCIRYFMASLSRAVAHFPDVHSGNFFVCPHKPSNSCACRKPSPYMLLWAIERFQQRRDRTLYVGDMKSDYECAQRADVRFMWDWAFFGRKTPSDIFLQDQTANASAE